MPYIPVMLAAALSAGTMAIRFRTEGPLDFTRYRYVVAFNTTGNGRIPLAASLGSFGDWSFELIFGGGGAGAGYALQQIYAAGGNYNAVGIAIPPAAVLEFEPSGNEFTFVFKRALLHPFVPATVSTRWALNFFATDPSGNPLDSAGINGPNDAGPTCCTLTTTAPADLAINKPLPPPYQPPSASATIAAVEVVNTP